MGEAAFAMSVTVAARLESQGHSDAPGVTCQTKTATLILFSPPVLLTSSAPAVPDVCAVARPDQLHHAGAFSLRPLPLLQGGAALLLEMSNDGADEIDRVGPDAGQLAQTRQPGRVRAGGQQQAAVL